MAGGCCLCLGNLATQYALAFVGLSITETIMSSITVVIGAHRAETYRQDPRAYNTGDACGMKSCISSAFGGMNPFLSYHRGVEHKGLRVSIGRVLAHVLVIGGLKVASDCLHIEVTSM